MCRHLGYVGPPVGVGELVVRGPHSLFAQSWAPADMRAGGTINADGFGVAWWRRADLGPGGGARRPRVGGARDVVTRYRNQAPIWTDPAVAEVLGQLESRSVIAAVRSATEGMPVERSACAPFTDDHWAFSHNGVIPDWRATLVAVLDELDDLFTAATSRGVPIAESPGRGAEFGSTAPDSHDVPAAAQGVAASADAVLGDASATATSEVTQSFVPTALFGSPAVLLEAEALTDSAALWVLLRGLLGAISTAGPVTSAADALQLLVALILRHQPTARLNLMLGNGIQLWATTCWHSLSVLVADDHTVLSSEPYDADPRWRSIADRQLVVATPGHCIITELELPDTERVRS
ncbi:class II glutamine amidotransferase [Nocardia sp. NPDC058633]|uniref:class II glutamine amidotransferase n=1 Tax=Nocardia sp. NPDC058633 TaxID=3346568 RepID=UPI0036538FAE